MVAVAKRRCRHTWHAWRAVQDELCTDAHLGEKQSDPETRLLAHRTRLERASDTPLPIKQEVSMA